MSKFLRTFQSDFALPRPANNACADLPPRTRSAPSALRTAAASVGFAVGSALYWPVTRLHSLKSFCPIAWRNAQHESVFPTLCLEFTNPRLLPTLFK